MKSRTSRSRSGSDELSIIKMPDRFKKGTFQLKVEKNRGEIFLKVAYETPQNETAIARMPVDNLMLFLQGECMQLRSAQ